ncbi:MAG: hypothetical protein PVJ42_02995 [bacterium]|jgi:hypothetical protein
MKASIKALGLLALLCALTISSGCLLEEKVIELVLSGETCAEFQEDHATGDFSSESLLAYGDEIQDILDDNDIDRSDISRAFVVGGSYEVTDFSHTHDWTVGGAVLVERIGAKAEADTLLRYTSQPLTEALDNQIWAELHPDGVDVLNTALEDFLNGQQPVLKFTVDNGTTTPEPSSSDRIVFDWQTCIKIQLIYAEEFEFPDT